MTNPMNAEAVAQMAANQQCPFCNSMRTEPLRGDTFCSDCGRVGKTMSFRDYVDMAEGEIAALSAQLEALAAENATLRASEAAAVEALAEIGVAVAALEGADSLDKEIIRNIGTRLASLTPTTDKEPKT